MQDYRDSKLLKKEILRQSFSALEAATKTQRMLIEDDSDDSKVGDESVKGNQSDDESELEESDDIGEVTFLIPFLTFFSVTSF
jgi:hypothetical protein